MFLALLWLEKSRPRVNFSSDILPIYVSTQNKYSIFDIKWTNF